jgi:hypothetical protein
MSVLLLPQQTVRFIYNFKPDIKNRFEGFVIDTLYLFFRLGLGLLLN